MDDWKLKECWVLVEDCFRTLLYDFDAASKEDEESPPILDAISTTVVHRLESDDDEIPPVLDAFNSTCPLAQVVSKIPMRDAVGMGHNPESTLPNFTGPERVRETKSKKYGRSRRQRRRSSAGNNDLKATHAKSHLLQKYGRSLLRKPILSVAADSSPLMPLVSSTGFSSEYSYKSSSPGRCKVTDVPDETSFSAGDARPPSPGSHKVPGDARPLSPGSHKITGTVEEFNSFQDSLTGQRNAEVVSDANNQLFSNPFHPMPPVSMTIGVGVGLPLASMQARCILTCLDECHNSISDKFAEFCSSVVKTAPNKAIVLPISDKRILQFMEIKWKSRSNVKLVPISEVFSCKPNSTGKLPLEKACESTSVPPSNSSDEHANKKCVNKARNIGCSSKVPGRKRRHSVMNQTEFSSSECQSQAQLPDKRVKLSLLAADKRKSTDCGATECSSTSNREVPAAERDKTDKSAYAANSVIQQKSLDFDKHLSDPPYDPDDLRGVQSAEEDVEELTTVPRQRSSHLVHELRRLNVALFDMTNNVNPVVCKTPDICRLGCVCSSLCSKVLRENCGLEKCIFTCTCSKQPSRHESPDVSYSWVQNKAKANLAKEEQQFKQTVVRSGTDDLIVVEGKRKRDIKLPERYRESFKLDSELEVIHRFGSNGASKSLTLNVEKVSEKHHRAKPAGKNRGSLDSSFGGSSSKSNFKSKLDNLESSNNSHLPAADDVEDHYSGTSARTSIYQFKLKEYSPKRTEEAKSESQCEVVSGDSGLKILSVETLSKESWVIGTDSLVLTADTSCSLLFDPAFANANGGNGVVLPLEALKRDLSKKLVFMWLKLINDKFKLYLTNKLVKPCLDCVELNSVNVSDKKYECIPFNLNSLLSDYMLPGGDKDYKWILKLKGWYWVVVGVMEPSKLPREVCASEEIDVLSSTFSCGYQRWWAMDVNQDFDIIYFLDFKKAIKKDQLTTLLKLSNEYAEGQKKFHRILLNRRRPQVDPIPPSYPDFGAYSLPNRSEEVFIGPYDYCGEPRFQVYTVKIAHNGKAQYEKVPLFYCGDGECVRVNSNGILSLHSEDLPNKYVKGYWCESHSDKVRGEIAPMEPKTAHVSETKSMPLPSELPIDDLPATHISHKFSNGEEKDSILSSVPRKEAGIENTKDVSDHPDVGANFKKDYLVPSVREIGWLPLTYLPNGAISVPHFTEPGLLKFFHSKDDLVKEINETIHHKLACLSRKCSFFLGSSGRCKCITWQSVSDEEGCANFPQFSPEIFNGFRMLTKYGLVDLRTADKSALKQLGQDWIEWLKNDEFRIKLYDWKSEQALAKQSNNLLKLLSKNENSKLALQDVLSLATSEIAKLKAEDQLLDCEMKTQQLLKETLIYSLCRKLNGIPGTIVPQFLGQMSLDVVWEILECMDSRNTNLLPIDSSAKQPLLKVHGLKSKERQEELSGQLIHEAEEQQEKNQLSVSVAKYDSIAKKDQPPDAVEKHFSTEKRKTTTCQVFEDAYEQQQMDQIRKQGQPPQDGSQKSLVYHVSPFSRLNISVGESGIKRSPLSSPPLSAGDSNSTFRTSPGKQPLILRKSTGVTKASSLTVMDLITPTGNTNHARRKQTFSSGTENDDEPIFVEDKEEFDEESSDSGTEVLGPGAQRISKTVSCILDLSEKIEVPSTSVSTEENQKSSLALSLATSSDGSTACSPKELGFVSMSDPSCDAISPLRIVSVESTAAQGLPITSQTQDSPSSSVCFSESTADSIASLRIASVTSLSQPRVINAVNSPTMTVRYDAPKLHFSNARANRGPLPFTFRTNLVPARLPMSRPLLLSAVASNKPRFTVAKQNMNVSLLNNAQKRTIQIIQKGGNRMALPVGHYKILKPPANPSQSLVSNASGIVSVPILPNIVVTHQMPIPAKTTDLK